MKRRPLPDRELQIARRLRQVRDSLRLTQTEFAEQIGIRRERLASYEEGRVPLRYDIALRLCHQFITSEKWLSTGQGNPRLLVDLLLDPIAAKIPADRAFSKAFDEAFALRYEERIDQCEKAGVLPFVLAPDDSWTRIENLFRGIINGWLEELPEIERGTFLISLLEDAKQKMRRRPFAAWPDFCRNRAAKQGTPQISATQGNNPSKKELADSLQYDKLQSVKFDWKWQRERLNRLTATRGAKSALAGRLGVPLSSLSLWLSGEREPGVKIAFRLLAWADEREEKLRTQL